MSLETLNTALGSAMEYIEGFPINDHDDDDDDDAGRENVVLGCTVLRVFIVDAMRQPATKGAQPASRSVAAWPALIAVEF